MPTDDQWCNQQTNETSRRDGGVKTTLNVFISS